MTNLEKNLLKLITTEVGLSIIINHDSIEIGKKGQLEEPIVIPITHDELDLIRDLKRPLIDKLLNMLNDGDYFPEDEVILNSLLDSIT